MLRGYGAALTGVLSSVFSFDAMWCLTKLDAFEGFFLSMIIGFFAVAVYLFATEPKQSRKPRYDWVTDDMGLSYMVRGGKS